MHSRPATDDLNKRAGFPYWSRDSDSLLIPGSRAEARQTRQVDNQFEDGNHDWQQRIFSMLLHRVPGLAFRCRPDQDRTLELISDSCFELTGYRADDLIGNRVIAYGELIIPEDRRLLWTNLGEVLREKESYEFIYRIRTAGKLVKWIRELGQALFSPEGKIVALEGILFDITDQKQSEKLVQHQIDRFDALRKIDLAITGSFDIRVTLDILLDQVTTHLMVDAADILLFDPFTKTLEYFTGRGFQTTSQQNTRLRMGEGFAGIAALEHHAVRVDNLNESPGELKRSPHILNEGFRVYYGIPLIMKGQVKGILEIYHRNAFEPGGEWVEFLEALASQAAIAIENSILFKELQRSNVEITLAYDATLEGWSKTLELRDGRMIGHTQRISDLSLRLAQAMGYDGSDLVTIRRGSLLHDIGEIGISDKILLKPGPLNEEEWNIVRQHPLNAYQLLSSIPNLHSALEIPYCHHENWDGTGYPRNLKGNQIPLSARIFSVVDVWDTLLSNRPYRKAWQRQQAYQYLQEASGRKFDPHVVDVFFSMIVEKPVVRE